MWEFTCLLFLFLFPIVYFAVRPNRALCLSCPSVCLAARINPTSVSLSAPVSPSHVFFVCWRAVLCAQWPSLSVATGWGFVIVAFPYPMSSSISSSVHLCVWLVPCYATLRYPRRRRPLKHRLFDLFRFVSPGFLSLRVSSFSVPSRVRRRVGDAS
ncbi:uncharacterized protein IWZ02DRAFT_53195 [Phyllosticta citriasiana]|uniref:uncharacterized protein n=1 Tax=Phyllosticta citriasiana TaxID=595635 RepID=UPI0030FDADAF